MNLLRIWNWINNSPGPSNSPALSATKTSPDTLSPENSVNMEGPWWKLYFKLKEANAFDYLDPSIATGNELGDLVYKMLYNLGENKENDFADSLLLVSLDKLMKDTNKLYDKIDSRCK